MLEDLHPTSFKTVEENTTSFKTEKLFLNTQTNMADASELIMKRNNLTNQDVDWLVPSGE
jgi:3-oxoacyl-[acyl-carrier-protein] synthase-3